MSELKKKIEEQIKAISTQLYGIEDTIKIFCLSKASDLTILLIGEHGIAKSSLARLWTDTMSVRDAESGELRPMTFRIVTSSEVDDSLIAHPDIAVFRAENKLVMKRGELMIKDHIFIDELYLWSNKYRAKLHQLLEEGTYAGLSVLTKTYTFACVDEETEVFSKEGWKKYFQLREGEEILTFNLDTKKLEYKPIRKIYVYDYNGELLGLENRDISMRVTPNHKCVIFRRFYTRKGRMIVFPELVEAEKLKASYGILQSAQYKFYEPYRREFLELLEREGYQRLDGRSSFHTAFKEKADYIQRLAILNGFRANISESKGKYKEYRVYLTNHRGFWVKQNLKRFNYKGKVWCPNTENGTFVARREGKVFITGNTNPLTEWYSGQIETRNLATEDRIDVFIPMFQPDITSTQKMMKKFGKYGKKPLPLEKIATWDDYEAMRKKIHDINFPADKLVWLSLLAEECSACKYTKSKFDIGQATMSVKCKECNRNQCICAKVGLSKPRFVRATVLLSKALAWYDGRNEVIWSDLYEAIKYTMPHRLIFLQKQVSILDAPKEIEEIIRMFNEDMEQWRNRDIFNKLEKIILASRESPPKYLRDEVQGLLLEIQEDLPILNYAKETIGLAEKKVKTYYMDIAKSGSITPEKVDEFRDELDNSGLDEYAKSDIFQVLGVEYVPKKKKKTG